MANSIARNTSINHLQQVADASQHLRVHRQPAVHGITCRTGWRVRNVAEMWAGRHGEAARRCWGPLSQRLRVRPVMLFRRLPGLATRRMANSCWNMMMAARKDGRWASSLNVNGDDICRHNEWILLFCHWGRETTQLAHRTGGRVCRALLKCGSQTGRGLAWYGMLATHTSKYGSSVFMTSPWMTCWHAHPGRNDAREPEWT